MKLEGVPEGYEVVRFANPAIGERYVDTTGTVKQCVEEVGGLRLIVRKVEPAATWIHGVLLDGYVAEDKDGDQFWYGLKPTRELNEECWKWPIGCRGTTIMGFSPKVFRRFVKFRDDLPWTERIVAVGPTAEGDIP